MERTEGVGEYTMRKKLKLIDYDRQPKYFWLNNFENVIAIHITILSGDEIATVIYNNHDYVVCDSSDCRYTDYYDGMYVVNPKDVNKFNKLKGSSYDRCILYKPFKGDEQ